MPDKLPQEPLIQSDIPTRPWEKVGVDLFQIADRSYLVTVDYYSHFFEVDYLPDDTKSEAIVSKMKQHFARHGIPDKVVSDNGPQFTSGVFKKFTKGWGFVHETISPGNSRANGAAEAAVKTAKRLMKKAEKDREDPYISLLNLRNTPTEGTNSSPVQ